MRLNFEHRAHREISLIGEFVLEAADPELVRALGRLGGGNAVERQDAVGGDCRGRARSQRINSAALGARRCRDDGAQGNRAREPATLVNVKTHIKPQQHSRNRRVNEVEVPLKLSGNRVAHRADRLLASLGVGIDSKAGVEELIRLAHGHRNAEPITGGRDDGRV